MVCASLAAGPARVPASIRSSPALAPSPHAVGRRDDGRTSGARMMLGGTRRESLQHSRTARRRPDKPRAYREAAAAVRRGSINDVVRDIIQSHIYQHPMISAHEADALYQSNYQLLTIGRNLNQIARRLNAGENASLTGNDIAALKAYIDAHTSKVAAVLQTHRRRKRGHTTRKAAHEP